MRIALYHSHYSIDHLALVTSQMQQLGSPVIRCIWSECYSLWMAIEGCHRLRAAHALGIVPIIEDVTDQQVVTIQCDDCDAEMDIAALAEDLTDGLWQAVVLEWEG